MLHQSVIVFTVNIQCLLWTAIPSAITTYQAAVRTKSNEHQVAIDAAANVDALAALTFDWPIEPS